MRWEDERYVKVYTRDTPDWLMLSLDAQGLFMLLLRKVDRAGILHLGRHGTRAVAVAIGHVGCLERVENALSELEKDGCVLISGEKLLIRNFQEAQEARQSDRARQQAARERARLSVTKRDTVSQNVTFESQNVTNSHTASHDVTRRHTMSHGVTPRIDKTRLEQTRSPYSPPLGDRELFDTLEPNGDQPRRQDAEGSELPGKPNRKQRASVDRWRHEAEQVLDALSAARMRVKPKSHALKPSYESLAGIAGRLDAGKTVDECLHVVAVCEDECVRNPDSFQWFNAVSPFRPENFERKAASVLKPAGPELSPEQELAVWHFRRRTILGDKTGRFGLDYSAEERAKYKISDDDIIAAKTECEEREAREREEAEREYAQSMGDGNA